MTVTADNLFVITGAPGAGKTTLLDALAARGFTIGQEAARAIIKMQTVIDGPALQWRDSAMFAELMLDRDLRTHEMLRTHPAAAFCDRAIPDLIAYGRMLSLPETGHYTRAARLFRYNRVVFFAPPWREIFATDAERIEGWDHAQRNYEPMQDAYREVGYEVVELPKAPVADRLAFVLDRVGHG